jgi:hypothetical protein
MVERKCPAAITPMERTEERFTYMDKKGKRKGRSTMGQVIIMDGYMEAGS